MFVARIRETSITGDDIAISRAFNCILSSHVPRCIRINEYLSTPSSPPLSLSRARIPKSNRRKWGRGDAIRSPLFTNSFAGPSTFLPPSFVIARIIGVSAFPCLFRDYFASFPPRRRSHTRNHEANNSSSIIHRITPA